MLPRSNFSSFPQYFQNVSNLGVRLHIHSVKGGCSINCFPESANLICRSTDISNCFIESLGVRDNESRLYVYRNDTHADLSMVNLHILLSGKDFCLLPFIICLSSSISFLLKPTTQSELYESYMILIMLLFLFSAYFYFC